MEMEVQKELLASTLRSRSTRSSDVSTNASQSKTLSSSSSHHDLGRGSFSKLIGKRRESFGSTESDERHDQLHHRIFLASSVRVLKKNNLMKIYMPRFLRLQTGSQPYLEYARTEHGEARQRKRIGITTNLQRVQKNKLVINFIPEKEVSTDLVANKYSYELITQQLDPVDETQQQNHCKNMPKRLEKWVIRLETKQERDGWAKKIQDAIDLFVWIRKYRFGRVLENSHGSTVMECFGSADSTSPSYVMKVLDTFNKKSTHIARNEANIHQLLNHLSSHVNILQLHDILRQKEKTYLVLEYCAGGDLFEYLHRHGYMSESSGRVMFGGIMKALERIHAQSIVHLDIKPENIFFKSASSADDLQLPVVESVKLGDFGSARFVSKVIPSQAITCTVGYAAPEVLERGEVSYAADVFSAGALLYTTLSGCNPFHAHSDGDKRDLTLAGKYTFDDPVWQVISKEAKDLIQGMLEVDPVMRLTMDQVINHPWLTACKERSA
jgi:tRNA A-37 threonylcarbamoyl transferase component Bud32